ncbi:MAG: hypothetical protein ABIN67_21000 [Ferruginibacter sp.]
MKQAAAILLLGIFSFNLFGYRLVASFLEKKVNAEMEISLDENDYNYDQLISIKQPTNLPYYRNSAHFQRIDGEIEINNIYYKYVKCRIYNDSLELLCIPNTGKMKIQAAKADFSGMVSDFQQTESKKKSEPGTKSFQKILGDYEEVRQTAYSINTNALRLNHNLKNSQFVNTLFLQTAEQPPDFRATLS